MRLFQFRNQIFKCLNDETYTRTEHPHPLPCARNFIARGKHVPILLCENSRFFRGSDVPLDLGLCGDSFLHTLDCKLFRPRPGSCGENSIRRGEFLARSLLEDTEAGREPVLRRIDGMRARLEKRKTVQARRLSKGIVRWSCVGWNCGIFPAKL